MIRFKRISKRYPNGLTWAEYHTEDIPNEPWHPAMLKLIELIQRDSKHGWQRIFSNIIERLKNSAFYPVMTSFSDWEADYSQDSIWKFHPQMEAIITFYEADYPKGEEAGQRIYPPRDGKGSTRWLFGHQLPRVRSYTKDQLLQMLNRVALLGKVIPISGWETNLSYGKKIRVMCDDYSEYLLQVYLLPPSWYILEALQTKSWLTILIHRQSSTVFTRG